MSMIRKDVPENAMQSKFKY